MKLLIDAGRKSEPEARERAVEVRKRCGRKLRLRIRHAEEGRERVVLTSVLERGHLTVRSCGADHHSNHGEQRSKHPHAGLPVSEDGSRRDPPRSAAPAPAPACASHGANRGWIGPSSVRQGAEQPGRAVLCSATLGGTVDADEFAAALKHAAQGDALAADRLFPLVYEALRQQAARYLRAERVAHTLQPTALAHEAYLRLAGQPDSAWQDRAHFLAVAARAMRRILVDHARRKRAGKRGSGETPVELDTGVELAARAGPVEFDDLDRALVDLARLSERQARVVELRYFGGLSIEETGEVLGVSPMTVKRDWATARAWLYRELSS
ncbi:MAG: sigma-70 family RNA polymerase sigma factor [Candidatus Eisenbacteria bacterium]|uniref:Sigma-70 family RNA polymerase sigma factor n=1 Tax=Eiseniibacteriota bacterium TaxID=2212470 RepID=A0A849SKC4_UNCEI|nr:sigma-70 family RNA polymerase sigma factor [Candidatus Eisenbacteria bacterium]